MASKTLENLLAAFAGESQANRKYTAYAAQAEKEGKLNAAKLFRAAADAETIHALAEFKAAGKVGTTAENLQAGIDGETYEYKEMYPEFLEQAIKDGDKAAIRAFTYALEAEKVHAALYTEALSLINEESEETYYLCPVCGYIEKGQAPDKCPICAVKGDKFIQY